MGKYYETRNFLDPRVDVKRVSEFEGLKIPFLPLKTWLE